MSCDINIWHVPPVLGTLIMPGAVWLLRVSAGGERASVERARWAQAGGASTTRAITLVGLGSICAGVDPAQELAWQADLFQAQNPFTL